MSTKTIKSGLSKANVNAIAGAIGTATLNRLVPQFSTSVAYEKGQYTNYNNQLYRFTADKSAGAWDSTKVESASLNDLINDVNDAVESVNNKANVDGNYPTMTVGNADQLNSTVYVLDKVPYLYRTSGGDSDIGNREYDKIIGGSIVVNQLRTDATISGTANVSSAYSNFGRSSASLIYGHRYLVWFDVKLASDNVDTSAFNFKLGDGTKSEFVISVADATTDFKHYQRIAPLQNLGTQPVSNNVFFQHGNNSDKLSIEWKNLNVFDLDTMFGSTIADYIYSLEQANAGAGVAWFRNYFQELYYPYNAGAIKSVKLVSHDMVGFNQWDEEWEVGVYNITNGNKQVDSSHIRSKNFIKVFPNTVYYMKGLFDYGVCFYDENKNFISVVFPQYINITTPANCHYMTFTCSVSYGTTYNHDICINLSWSGWRNGQYEPYQKNSYQLDTTIELRGIPKLDSDNHLYFDGDEYSSDGKVVRKYGIVDLGTLTYTKSGSAPNIYFQANITGIKKTTASSDLLNVSCSKYTAIQQSVWYTGDKVIFGLTNQATIAIRDISYNDSDVTAFKTAMSGVYLVYELATTTEENATPFQEPQIVDDFGTEEYVVPTQDGWQVPVGHDTKYPANLRDKLQRLPDMPSVSQNVTETYVVNYNGTTKKCTFVDIAGWLGTNGWIKLTDISGYDAEKTQTLKNVEGTLTWVDD